MRFQGVLAFIVLVAAGSPNSAGQIPLHVVTTDDDTFVERIHAIDAAASRGDWRFALQQMQEILDTDGTRAPRGAESMEDDGNTEEVRKSHWDRPGFRPIEFSMYPDPHAKGIHFAATRFITRRLTAQSAEVLALYRKMFETRAAEQFEKARLRGDLAGLRRVAEAFPATRAGFRALQTHAHGVLETGELAEAALRFEDLFDIGWDAATRAEDPGAERLPLAATYAVLGERRLLERLIGDEQGSVNVGARDVDAEIYFKELLAQASRRPGRSMDGRARNGVVKSVDAAVTGPLSVQWQVGTDEFSDSRLERLACEPVIAGDRVVYHTRSFVRAVSLESGDMLWSHPFGQKKGDIPASGSRTLRHLRGATGAGLYVFCAAGHESREHPTQREICAVDLRNGRPRWRLRGDRLGPLNTSDDDRLRLCFDPAPLIVGDTVYVTATSHHDTPQSYLVAIHAPSGELSWITQYGAGAPLPYQTEDGDMPPARHFIEALPPAHARGMIYVCDNLGTFAAIEARTGHPRFLFRYDRRRAEAESRFGTAAVSRGFESNPIMVDGDVCVLAPDDGGEVHVLFTRPPGDAARRRAGKNYLRAHSQPRGRFTRLVGFEDGVVYLTGRQEYDDQAIVEAFSPLDPRRFNRWPASAPLDSAIRMRGAVEATGILVCSEKYLFRVDKKTGAVSNPLLAREGEKADDLGHVIPFPGGVLLGARNGVFRLGPRSR